MQGDYQAKKACSAHSEEFIRLGKNEKGRGQVQFQQAG